MNNTIIIFVFQIYKKYEVLQSAHNIILSNTGWGINYSGSGTVIADYNCVYGNTAGGIDTGITTGSHNTNANPYIDTITTFEINSFSSTCIDTGTNIAGISDSYSGSGPDMGWKEYLNILLYFFLNQFQILY